MPLESSGTILYVAKISYQSHNWFGNCQGGPKLQPAHARMHTRIHIHTETHRDTHTHTETHRDTHTHTHTHRERDAQRHTHTDTDTQRPILCLVFLRNCRNKTKIALNVTPVTIELMENERRKKVFLILGSVFSTHLIMKLL